MRRWSKEPRRIWVVEGRAAASLVRALRIVCCFIYNNETTEDRFCQYLPEHLFHICFGVSRVGALRSSFTDTLRPPVAPESWSMHAVRQGGREICHIISQSRPEALNP